MAPDHADFVARFEATWASPLMEDTRSSAGAVEEFSRVLALLPDLRGTVHRWAGRGDDVLIEFDLAATLGRRRLVWPVVDRITLRNALARH